MLTGIMRCNAVAAAYQDDVRTEPLSCWRNNLLKGSSYSTVTGIPCICSSVRPDVGKKQTSTKNPASKLLLVMQLTNSTVPFRLQHVLPSSVAKDAKDQMG